MPKAEGAALAVRGTMLEIGKKRSPSGAGQRPGLDGTMNDSGFEITFEEPENLESPENLVKPVGGASGFLC